MSELKPQLTEAMKAAMKAKDSDRLKTVRLILAELKRIEVDERIELTDERILSVLDKMSKQRRDSIAQFQAAGREDLVATEQTELEVISTFLPAALTDEELSTLISDAIASTGASSMRDMGAVMAALKPKVQGRADMAQVSQKIKAQLN